MLETIAAGVATLVIAPLVVWLVQHVYQTRWQQKQRDEDARKADEIVVSRLTERDHEDATHVVNLYTEIFEDDGTNYSPEELIEFLTKPVFTDRLVPEIENIVLVAKHRSAVVGFLFCHFYPVRRKAIISYYAIDGDNKRARIKAAAASEMAKKLHWLLSQATRPCDFLFFDTQNPDVQLDKIENRKRRARPALFKLTAESLGLHAYKLHFDYRCPRVSLASGACEYPFTLLCIPLPGTTLPIPIPRDMIMEFLSFIYEDCYGDMYPLSDPRFATHHDYLVGLVSEYRTSLPEYTHAD